MTGDAFSLRLRGGNWSANYPGDTQTGPDWQRQASLWVMEIDVPDLAADSLLTPSLSVINNWPYEFEFELVCGKHRWPLPRVPSDPGSKAPVGTSNRVIGQLDCWHVRQDLCNARLRIRCAAASVPQQYLLTLSGRAMQLKDLPPPPERDVQTARPVAFSQMLENPRIASRICSPASLAMVLSGAKHTQAPLHRVVPLCRDPATGMYGMWPLAIRAASRFGIPGAVEVLSDWSLVTTSLEAGKPVVASIRYRKNTLSGSPQAASQGHLVVVYGISGSRVLVNDPAAPDRGTVNRRYDIGQFSEAWFRHRGAAYILAS
jgi:hypothetical protein